MKFYFLTFLAGLSVAVIVNTALGGSRHTETPEVSKISPCDPRINPTKAPKPVKGE